MITSTNLKALRNLEAFQVYSDLAAFLKQEEKGKEFEEPLKGVCDTFYARLQDYDTALSPERRNPRTAELARLDAQRDYILRSFIANLKLYVASPDAEQAQTADILRHALPAGDGGHHQFVAGHGHQGTCGFAQKTVCGALGNLPAHRQHPIRANHALPHRHGIGILTGNKQNGARHGTNGI